MWAGAGAGEQSTVTSTVLTTRAQSTQEWWGGTPGDLKVRGARL